MENSTVISVILTLSGSGDPELTVTLELTSRLARELSDWDLQFDLPRPVTAGKTTRLLFQVGSHIGLQPASNAPLRPGLSARVSFTVAANSLQRLTDLPAGFYLRSGAEVFPVRLQGHNLRAFLASSAARPGGNNERPLTATVAWSPLPESNFPVVPRPQDIRPGHGWLRLATPLRYHCADDAQASTARDWLALQLGPAIAVSGGERARSQLQFVHDESLTAEAYELHICAEGIEVRASGPAGFFYAATSLAQLAQADGTASALPCLSITDQPRFGYRGFMLDCARHFHGKDTVLAILDHMARYKLNHFHWHLTDDEGWRLPVPALAALTLAGAWRGEGEALAPQFGSGPERYGGYYTEADIHEVVAYARQRHITVVPEVDIPGHSRAAIRALPELLTEPADRSRYRSVQLYNDNVLNPALPGTYQFLDTVLNQVCTLFPGPYIHIGGDEVPAGVWEQSPACQAMRAEYGYTSATDLQGHLLRHVREFLLARGRQLLGWEEVAHGEKLPLDAIVCAWSSSESAAGVAQAGYRVINCPAPFAYLDLAWDDQLEEPGYYWAGTADLAACYACEPGAREPHEATRAQIIGVQAQLWSELVTDRHRLEYMLFPRLLAWAELGWTEPGNKHWPDFLRRAQRELALLANQGVNHHSL
jgi:hexosaminidase